MDFNLVRDLNEKSAIYIQSKMSQEITIAPVLREDLVAKAISFLTNPSTLSHPQEEKERFLLTRGLTHEELKAAIERSSSLTQSAFPPYLQQQPTTMTPLTTFQKFRDILQTIALLTGVTYGIYHFIKHIIIPFLFGKSKKPTELEKAVMDLNKTVNESVGQLRTEVLNIQSDLARVRDVQQQQQASVRCLGDIKLEVATVKGILLSRNQFPSVPLTGSASIPAWQMAACQDSADRSSEVQNSNGGSQNSDSSLEMIKEAEVADVEP